MVVKKNRLSRDPRLKRSKVAMERLLETSNTDALLDELFTLQSGRGVSALNPKRVLRGASATLIKSSVEEIAVRSRAVTIKMTCLRSLLTIEEMSEHLRKYLLAKYGDQLKEMGYSTISDKRGAVDVELRVFIDAKRQLDYVCKIADLVITDTDAAGWGLKRISDTLTQNSKDR